MLARAFQTRVKLFLHSCQTLVAKSQTDDIHKPEKALQQFQQTKIQKKYFINHYTKLYDAFSQKSFVLGLAEYENLASWGKASLQMHGN